MKWFKSILDKHVAPNVSEFTSFAIDDLKLEFEDWAHWCTNHFLNSVLRKAFEDPLRLYAVNFVRRAQATFEFYDSAREATTAYIEGNEPYNPKVGQYYRALTVWEAVFLNWGICFELIFKLSGKKLYEPRDGSSEQRAHEMYNTIKHHGGHIRRGDLGDGDSLPFWLSNDGFESKTASLAYAELADLVRDAARLAHALQDPLSFRTRGERDQPEAAES